MKEILKSHGLDTKEEYFDLIMAHHMSGKSALAKHMFHLLQPEDRRTFFEYVETSFFYDGEQSDVQVDMNSLYVFFEEDTSPWTHQDNDDEQSEDNSWQRWK